MKYTVFICIMLLYGAILPAQDQTPITSFVNTDDVFVWIERATTLQKQLNKTKAEKEELDRLVSRVILEKKKAELNYSAADTQLQQLANACKEAQGESARVRDSLNNLIQEYLKQLETSDIRRRELENSIKIFKETTKNQEYLLDARALEFAEAQQFIVGFSNIQINVRDLWIRLEDNPSAIFASNKRDRIKVVAYYVRSNFDVWRAEVPVRFRLMRKTGSGRNIKADTIIDVEFNIPSVAKLSETQVNGLSTSNLLQKFEGEYTIPINTDEIAKLESGTYYYEILVDRAVEKRSYEFELVNRIWGR